MPPPPKNYYYYKMTYFKQGMTNTVGFTCSVGDTILWFTIDIEQDNQNW